MTTEGIYWFDERYPGKPVLGIKHYRDFDRTLGARTALLRSGAEVDSQPVTFLTSRRTGLVSVYDVSRGEDDLVHMNAPSHCLPYITPHGGLPVSSWNLFQHPLMDPSYVDVLHLSSRGDISRLHAQLHSDGDIDFASDRNQGFMWNDEVKLLKSANLGVTGSDRLTVRESSTANLGPAYKGWPRPVHYGCRHLYSHIPKIFSSPPLERTGTQTLRTMLWTVYHRSGKISMPRWTIS